MDVVELVFCDFGGVKDCWYYGSFDFVGIVDKLFFGFVSNFLN